jgi:quinol monooxygenase YgiN
VTESFAGTWNRIPNKEQAMVGVGLYVPLQAKPGKEADLEAFLEEGRALVDEEPETIDWYAIKLGGGHYAIVDFFNDEDGRQAHLSGKVAEALMAKADELLAVPPEINSVDVLAVK